MPSLKIGFHFTFYSITNAKDGEQKAAQGKPVNSVLISAQLE